MTVRCQANVNGAFLERVVAAFLREFGFTHDHQFQTKCIGANDEEIKPDFWVPGLMDDGAYIECRCQESSGSADKKSNALYENAANGWYDKPVVVVVEGATSDKIYKYFKKRECTALRCMRIWDFLKFLEAESGGFSIPLEKHFDADQLRLFQP